MRKFGRLLLPVAGALLALGLVQVPASGAVDTGVADVDTTASSGHVVLGEAATAADGPTITGTDETVYTTDGNPGGKGVFRDYGEHLKACDIQGDGYRAVAYLYWVENGYEYLAWRHDADGANGNCKDNNLSIGEGVTVQLQVCLRNGSDGADRWCSNWEYATA